MDLRDDQLDRYARHIILKEIGGQGQIRLLNSHVVMIGAGGIGSPALQYLAAAGVGRITVIDDDHVSLSNLQRQTIYATDDIGKPKVKAAADAVRRITPDCTICGIQVRITADNVVELLTGADVVIDGCDNFTTRMIVADTALVLHIPLVSAAVGQFDGQLAVYRGWEADKPCYRCLVGQNPDRPDISCADQGVLGALTGVMGSMAALEVIRQITGFGEDSAGQLLLVDALNFRFRTLNFPKDPGCPTCGI